MARKFAKSFYNSKAWKRAREVYVVERFGICERCGVSSANQVHHRILLTPDNIENPDVTLNFNNFELLCDVCHQLEHNRKHSALELGLRFDADGNVIKSKLVAGFPPPYFDKKSPHSKDRSRRFRENMLSFEEGVVSD